MSVNLLQRAPFYGLWGTCPSTDAFARGSAMAGGEG
jgi:hypothetical protein